MVNPHWLINRGQICYRRPTFSPLLWLCQKLNWVLILIQICCFTLCLLTVSTINHHPLYYKTSRMLHSSIGCLHLPAFIHWWKLIKLLSIILHSFTVICIVLSAYLLSHITDTNGNGTRLHASSESQHSLLSLHRNGFAWIPKKKKKNT